MTTESQIPSPKLEVIPPLRGPDAIRANISSLLVSVEEPLKESRQLPQINLDWPLKQIGRELGKLTLGSNLFRRGEQVITIDPESGEVREMTSNRFCSYAEELCWPFKNKTHNSFGPAFSRFNKGLADLILSSDDFRNQTREVTAIYEPSLPAWQGEGSDKTIELIPRGYNPATKVYCAHSIDYERSLAASDALEWIIEMLGDFPWAETQNKSTLHSSRSFSAHIAGMLATFCTLLLGDHARRPMFPYLANQSASGKTRLAQIALAPVYGEPVTVNADQRADELEKIISTAALEQRQYLLLDDCGNFKSRALNMLLTSGRVSSRLLGLSKMVDAPNRVQVFLTGNAISMGHELLRRSVIVDLFYPGNLAERKFSHQITEAWVFSKETRSKLLSVLWSFVRHWRDHHELRCFPESKRASFESFASIIGSINMGVSLFNPFESRGSVLGGDNEGDALIELLRTVAGEVIDTDVLTEYRPRELMDKAESMGLLDAIVPHAKDQKKALGHQLKLQLGRQFRDTRGRLFEFGKREVSAGAAYPIRFLKK